MVSGGGGSRRFKYHFFRVVLCSVSSSVLRSEFLETIVFDLPVRAVVTVVSVWFCRKSFLFKIMFLLFQ